MQYLFVYGLLRSDVGGPLQATLAEAASFVGRASWRGRLYRVAEFPGAVPCEADEFVAGAEALLAELDAYEEVPDDYLRVQSTVKCADREFKAWVYVWNRSTDALERIESGDFANR